MPRRQDRESHKTHFAISRAKPSKCGTRIIKVHVLQQFQFIPVTEPQRIEQVAALAHEIWNQHFVPIIGQGQVDYMLAKFQIAPAITRQIEDGYAYYLIAEHDQPLGYFALVFDEAERSVMLSKFYILADHRGGGLGAAALGSIESLCTGRGMDTLWLTVNRHNAGPIAFYERHGFHNAGTLVQDIGGGYVMDDYKMVKSLAASGASGRAP